MILIPKEFNKTRELYSEYLSFVEGIPAEFIDEKKIMINKSSGNLWEDDLTEMFKKEYQYFLKSEIFFEGCSLSVFTETYNIRLEEFLGTKFDLLEIDFIVKQYNNLKKYKLFKFCPVDIKNQILISIRRQLEFLEERAVNLGYQIEKNETKNLFDAVKIQRFSNEDEILDLSDTDVVERIIYLEKLGIINYLREKNLLGISNNKLASLLSAIIGKNSSTIQSYINPIGNPSVSQKNNPLTKTKKVEIVTSKLIELGFFKP